MTIEELFKNGKLSVRTLNICQYNGLTNLSNLLLFNAKNGGFLKLRNCGKLSNDELENLCNEFDHFENDFIKYFLDIEESLTNEFYSKFINLSNSLKYKIKEYLRYDLSAINIYINLLSNQDFEVFKLGKIKSIDIAELQKFLIEIDDIIKNRFQCKGSELLYEQRETKISSFDSIISNLTRAQRVIINGFIDVNINSLSVRGNNAIKAFLNGDLKIRNFNDLILSNKSFNIQKIQNVGQKTALELEILIKQIKQFVQKIAFIQDENELASMQLKLLIEKTFFIEDIPVEIFESRSIGKVLEFLINRNALFEKNDNLIFTKGFNIFKNQKALNLDELSKYLNISRERTRQIRKGVFTSLIPKLNFIKNIEDNLFQKFGIDENIIFLYVDAEKNEHINEINRTNFSQEFNSILLQVYYSKDFQLIGDINDVLLPKMVNSREKHNWKNLYLVKNEIANLFNFYEFVNDISRRINDRIDEAYSLNFLSYVQGFLNNASHQELESISSLTENIILHEFGIFLDFHDNITFNRNTFKQVYEYAYEALKMIGEPASITSIRKKIQELNPGLNTNDEKIRPALKRKNGFVPIGRTSTFGLKEWEKEIDDFKGGTIREIVAEFLHNHTTPKSMNEICEYVKRYRPNTNVSSILTNLKLDQSNTFVFFKNSHVGLSHNKYDDSFKNLIKTHKESKTWYERYQEFGHFIQSESRLPLSSSKNIEEVTLYRWLNIQLRKIKSNSLDNVKKSQILDRIKELGNFGIRIEKEKLKHGRNRKTKFTILDLINFIEEYKRMPDSRDPKESKLYQFYNRQKDNLNNPSINIDEVLKLRNLVTLFGPTIKRKYTFSDLKEFISKYDRLPDSRIRSENGLNQFYYRNKDIILKNESNLIDLNDLAELISKYVKRKK